MPRDAVKIKTKTSRLEAVNSGASMLPFKIVGESSNDGESLIIESFGRQTVGWTSDTFDDEKGCGVISDTDRANAALMVHGANNINSLYEMARQMKNFIDTIDFSQVDGISYDDIPFAEWEAVLKKAGLVEIDNG